MLERKERGRTCLNASMLYVGSWFIDTGICGIGWRSTGLANVGETGIGVRWVKITSLSRLPLLGGGLCFVFNVEVDNTGLIVCESSDLLDELESSASSLRSSRAARSRASRSLCIFLRRSNQS